MNMNDFFAGQVFNAYEYFGSHKESGHIVFRTFAPNAANVCIFGSFNNWSEEPMTLESYGVYSFVSDSADFGDMYKYVIYTKSGERFEHCDPYGFGMELRPQWASYIVDLSEYKFTDDKWMECRNKNYNSPMNIYEVHLGSWLNNPQNENGWYNYSEIADKLIQYAKKHKYTHLEFLPLSEHPADCSWGYQNTGFFSPTSRYGTAAQLMELVDKCHKNNIGVIMDFVPVHFAVDGYGLAQYDGSYLYEYPPSDVGISEWGTCNFNHSRNETRCLVQSAANFWLEKFHVDGLRVDAVASMLYLDYGRQDGQWVPNDEGGRENKEAVEFLKHLNSIIYRRRPGAMMIAEESTAWPMVTGKAEDGGLNFTYKWNMGWMHDFLDYMKLDPYFRKNAHHMMTFSMEYAYSENYILVLSHDEVVHLKCSMLNKMPGLGIDKYRNLMVGYSFMMGHPGKKLLFMGQDFGQLREWSEARELDWYLLGEENHQKLQQYVSDLLHIYRKYPALYGADNDPSAFEWINANDGDRSIFSFVRKSPTRRNNILVVCNFTPVARPDYRVGVPKKKQYKLIMNEQGLLPKGKAFKAEKKNCDNREFSFAYPLEAYGVGVFTY